MTPEEITKECLELLEECETSDAVQVQLTEWERNFLDSNLERRDKAIESGWETPFRSEKVLNILKRIASYADRSSGRRGDRYSRPSKLSYDQSEAAEARRRRSE